MLDQSIIIILTPYHIKALKNVIDKYNFDARETIILIPDSIDSNLLKSLNLESLHIIKFSPLAYQLPGERFTKRLLLILKNPLYIKKLKSVFNNTKNFIDNTLEPILTKGEKQIIIFNDRDFMAQIAINRLKKKFADSISIIAIDEGLGFYVKESMKESIMKILYKIVSPILFGFNYRYIEQYGTHPQISEVYARFPDLIIKKDYINYHRIPFDLNTKEAFDKSKINSSKSILVISAPLTEENFVSEQVEINFYKFLGEYVYKNNLNLLWKPHPRENGNKLSNIVNKYIKIFPTNKFELIEKDNLAEQIDYSQNGAIITFGSSIILDLIYRGYPRENIITIKPYNFHLTEHIFHQTRLIIIDRNINLHLEQQLNDIFRTVL
jgi:hypothetical protein